MSRMIDWLDADGCGCWHLPKALSQVTECTGTSELCVLLVLSCDVIAGEMVERIVSSTCRDISSSKETEFVRLMLHLTS